MASRGTSPLNSIHVHMVAMSMGIIAALTAITLAALYLMSAPAGPSLSVYEMARLVNGLPLAENPGSIRSGRSGRAPPPPSGEAERLVSRLLAARLGREPADVRVTLGRLDRGRAELIARRAALYRADGEAVGRLLGPFTIGIREGGGWRTLSRQPYGVFERWRNMGWQGLLLSVLMVLPLTLWFSARLSRPIKAFAASAQRLGRGGTVEPVAVVGPSEIRLAAQALNEMQASISRFVRERTTLMGAIAHDLRTPLARLHFHLNAAPQPIRDAAAGELSEMERLIDIVLEFVENETRPPTREPLDLSMLVEGVVDDFADMGRDVTVAAAEPIVTAGDPLLLKRLFVNVIDNALKYGSAARVTVRRLAGDAVVTIADRGPGMSGEDIARAFEPFFRGEPSRNRGTGGAGLGLSIVRSAASVHGGAVALANGNGGGLVATVTLPVRGVADAA